MSNYNVPKGWKLVPVEPTEEIVDAIAHAKNMTRHGLSSVMSADELKGIYRAMLDAAPAAPVVQEDVQPVAFTAQSAPDGLYAVLFRDNWDGQGDRYHMLARKRNGLWLADESRRELFEYEGDAILRIWPLDANAPPAHPDAALVEALRNMLAAFDNPIARRKLGSEFCQQAIESARDALAGKGGE